MILTLIDEFPLTVPSDGMTEKTDNPFLLEHPQNFLTKENLTGKLEMFLISNSLVDDSPTKRLAKYINPSSGVILTSGLTPLPFKRTEQTVNVEYTFKVSS